MKVIHDKSNKQFTMEVDGENATVDYTEEPGKIVVKEESQYD